MKPIYNSAPVERTVRQEIEMLNAYPKWAEALVSVEILSAHVALGKMFAFAQSQGVEISNEKEARPLIEKWLQDAAPNHPGAAEALSVLRD